MPPDRFQNRASATWLKWIGVGATCISLAFGAGAVGAFVAKATVLWWLAPLLGGIGAFVAGAVGRRLLRR